MNEKIICPSCGTDHVEVLQEQHQRQITLGPMFSYLENHHKCKECGEEGNFLSSISESYSVAEKEAQKTMVKHLLEHLNSKELKMTHLERVFELPFRTITRWKSGDFSATSLAFLRTLSTFPWIAEVAEHRFEPVAAKQIMIKEAAKLFVNMVATDPFAALKIEVNNGAALTSISAHYIYTNKKASPDISVGDMPLVAGG